MATSVTSRAPHLPTGPVHTVLHHTAASPGLAPGLRSGEGPSVTG